jgi:hypothetical protein
MMFVTKPDSNLIRFDVNYTCGRLMRLRCGGLRFDLGAPAKRMLNPVRVRAFRPKIWTERPLSFGGA